MGIFSSLAGSVRVELTSADVARSLRDINEMQIPVSEVCDISDLTVQFTILRRDLMPIQKMAQRKGERFTVLSRKGVFWMLWGLRKRPVLLLGLAVLLALAVLTPKSVLFIQVEGNKQVPSRLIIEAAQDAGIRFGASRRAVRSEKMKNELLGALPQLQWAGVNTYGCTAVISVRERAVEPKLQEEVTVSSIIASCDGVITSCTITDGSGLCSVGQAVQKGQVLISGYTDCGGVTTAGRAQGEIFAQTRHELTAATPSETQIRAGITAEQTNFSLLMGKKRINFYKGSGISDGRCVKMVTQYHLTLPGGYRLPVTLVKEQIVVYETQPGQRNEEEAAVQLSGFAKALLRSEGVALTITDVQEASGIENGCVCLRGVYSCVEMIGREQGEQIGDFHGKTD